MSSRSSEYDSLLAKLDSRLLPPATQTKERRNSAIRQEAFTTDVVPVVRSSGSKDDLTAAGADDGDEPDEASAPVTDEATDEVGDLPHPAQMQREESLVAMEAPVEPIEEEEAAIDASISTISVELDKLLEFSGRLPASVEDYLSAMREDLENVRSILKEERLDLKERDDITACLELDKLEWNFDNPHVHTYRKGVVQQGAGMSSFDRWTSPCYEAHFPILPVKGMMASVQLPPARDGDDSMPRMTKIIVNAGATAASSVAMVMKKLRDPLPVERYALKAVGLEDYIVDHDRLLANEYVRQCIRDKAPIYLVLVEKPEPLAELPESATAGPKMYRELVRPDTVFLDDNDILALKTDVNDWTSMQAIALSDLENPFSIRVEGMDNFSPLTVPCLDASVEQVRVRVFLFHGDSIINGSMRETHSTRVSESPRWFERMTNHQDDALPVKMCDLPREVRICVQVLGRVFQNEVVLAYACLPLIDESGHLLVGSQRVRLWPLAAELPVQSVDAMFRATTCQNQSKDAPVLQLEMDEYLLPVAAPLVEKPPRNMPIHRPLPAKDVKKAREFLKKVESADALYEMEDGERIELWKVRREYMDQPEMLGRVLQCVDWASPSQRAEARTLLEQWRRPEDPLRVIGLLDYRYADYMVRKFAVDQLDALPDDRLQLFLLQLTQCLKFELYHDSPLTRFLMRRALQSPYQIGHFFFWHLKAEVQTPEYCERFACLLEEFVSHSGALAHELRKQNDAVNRLQRVAELVVRLKNERKMKDAQCQEEYMAELERLNRIFFRKLGSFQLPINPKWSATTLRPAKCRYMSSKKIPLWLNFHNKEEGAPPHIVMFKSGDDLRQDILTLQLLRVMDQIWLARGLDLRLTPYQCVATGVNDDGEGVGMIEIVLNSDTTSGIQVQYGGALGALQAEPIDMFLREHNKEGPALLAAKENFVHSCAGYCVATFVMGIGDRHNDNIMCTKDGHLFHIDFGHFLGNFKKKFGFNRERAPFVFTPEMAHVMGGKRSDDYKKFVNLCCQAYNALRAEATLLENMFVLMVSAGMPELLDPSDIGYLRDRLALHLSEKEAQKLFTKEIENSLSSLSRRLDNTIHNLKHNKLITFSWPFGKKKKSKNKG